MSKWIDADHAIERLGAYLMTDAQIEYGGLASEDIEDWKPIAIDILKGAPSIDVVFCKDCKWLRYCETEDLDLYLDCDKPDGGGIPRNEEWFCADGEKEGE